MPAEDALESRLLIAYEAGELLDLLDLVPQPPLVQRPFALAGGRFLGPRLLPLELLGALRPLQRPNGFLAPSLLVLGDLLVQDLRLRLGHLALLAQKSELELELVRVFGGLLELHPEPVVKPVHFERFFCGILVKLLLLEFHAEYVLLDGLIAPGFLEILEVILGLQQVFGVVEQSAFLGSHQLLLDLEAEVVDESVDAVVELAVLRLNSAGVAAGQRADVFHNILMEHTDIAKGRDSQLLL